MNPNVEKIAPFVFGVKFSLVKICCINGLPLTKNEIINPHAVLNSKGQIILNKDDAVFYPAMSQMLVEKIMPLNDKKLALHIVGMRELKKHPNYSYFEEVLLLLLKLEQQRRAMFKRKGIR